MSEKNQEVPEKLLEEVTGGTGQYTWTPCAKRFTAQCPGEQPHYCPLYGTANCMDGLIRDPLV